MNLSEEEFVTSARDSLTPNFTKLKILHMNIRSLNANVENLKQFLVNIEIDFDILILSEIWTCNIDFYAHIFDNYKFIYDIPVGTMVGGVAIYVHNSITFKRFMHRHKTLKCNAVMYIYSICPLFIWLDLTWKVSG